MRVLSVNREYVLFLYDDEHIAHTLAVSEQERVLHEHKEREQQHHARSTHECEEKIENDNASHALVGDDDHHCANERHRTDTQQQQQQQQHKHVRHTHSQQQQRINAVCDDACVTM